jgi:hypothetical protein
VFVPEARRFLTRLAEHAAQALGEFEGLHRRSVRFQSLRVCSEPHKLRR